MKKEVYLVTGGLGFIGSNFIKMLNKQGITPINIDKIGYASVYYPDIKQTVIASDIGDDFAVAKVLESFNPTKVINFAAESSVDKSLKDPDIFIKSNVVSTHKFYQSVYNYYKTLSEKDKKNFKVVHVSTDEVYGSLKLGDPVFTEESPYKPRNLYAASKASSDHIALSYFETYGLPVVVTHSSNNYGPRQHKEKFIPTVITNALSRKDIPLYGNGLNVRDWIYVEDNCEAIAKVLADGVVGEHYCIGGECERSNIQVIEEIMLALTMHGNFNYLVKYVEDRVGHDLRYALSNEKITRDTGWTPKMDFTDGLMKTISWYLEHR